MSSHNKTASASASDTPSHHPDMAASVWDITFGQIPVWMSMGTSVEKTMVFAFHQSA
jgi:hypothetical protein